MEADRRMVRDLLGGTATMRAAGEEYLPRQIKESPDAYFRRLRRSFLFPGLRHTVETFVGRVLGQPIITDDVAEPIRTYLDDVDTEGNNITVFARQVFFDAVAYGISGIFVDRDPLTPGSTLADARRQNNRPYFVHVPAHDLIGWRESQGGDIARVRIRESVPSPTGEWDDDTMIDQVRVIDQGRYAIYRPVEGASEWAVIGEGPSTPFVPFVPVYTCKTGFLTARPPLLDIAWLNVCHWQSSSDQRHIEHIIRVPILQASGFTADELGGLLEIGADRMIVCKDPAATMRYVEHSGAAAAIGRADLEDLERKMSDLGAAVLSREPAMETATKTAIDSAESGASLAAMVQSLQDALNLAIWYMARMLNISEPGGVVVPADLPSATEAAAEARQDAPADTPIRRTAPPGSPARQ